MGDGERGLISRRGVIAAFGAGAAAMAGTAYYGSLVETFWLEVVEHTVEVDGWPEALSGVRIAQLTDVHFEARASVAFAREVARRVREEIRPDLVAFTGDLTTHDYDYLGVGSEWLASFGHPTVVCLGNHDYDPVTSARAGCPMVLAVELERRLEGSGVEVLRNRGVEIELPGKGKIPVAGVEDYYTGLTDPVRATKGLPAGPKLMLCHNPDAADYVDEATAGGLILAGHTHGGQIRIPGIGHLMTNLMRTERMLGAFQLKHSTLYVSKGVGYLLRARLFCRPEVVVHRIVRKQSQ